MQQSFSATAPQQPASLPFISVVLATFNGSKYLSQQLDSVLAQTYPNLEILITDDGSTDETIGLLQEYAGKDPRIRLMVHQPNQGYIKNFERGCRAAAGELIALCDQDDWWHPQKLEKLQAAIGTAPMIYSDSELCNEALEPSGAFLSQRVSCLDFNNCLQQAVFCRIYGHTMLLRRDFLEKAWPFLPIIPHDWWLSFVATLEGGIVYYPEALSKYRQHANNIFGAVGSKTRKHNKINNRQKKLAEIERNRQRMEAFYDRCPAERSEEKKVLAQLVQSYRSFALPDNWKRMILFFRYHHLLLASKKRSLLRQYLFCLKMFGAIK